MTGWIFISTPNLFPGSHNKSHDILQGYPHVIEPFQVKRAFWASPQKKRGERVSFAPSEESAGIKSKKA
jgi:hypothetical protein